MSRKLGGVDIFSLKAKMNVLTRKMWEIILESYFKIYALREEGSLQTSPPLS